MELLIALAILGGMYGAYWYVENRCNKEESNVEAVLDKIEADLKEAANKTARIAETVKDEAAKVEANAREVASKTESKNSTSNN